MTGLPREDIERGYHIRYLKAVIEAGLIKSIPVIALGNEETEQIGKEYRSREELLLFLDRSAAEIEALFQEELTNKRGIPQEEWPYVGTPWVNLPTEHDLRQLPHHTIVLSNMYLWNDPSVLFYEYNAMMKRFADDQRMPLIASELGVDSYDSRFHDPNNLSRGENEEVQQRGIIDIAKVTYGYNRYMQYDIYGKPTGKSMLSGVSWFEFQNEAIQF